MSEMMTVNQREEVVVVLEQNVHDVAPGCAYIGRYTRIVTLPFVPQKGMKFRGLWHPEDPVRCAVREVTLSRWDDGTVRGWRVFARLAPLMTTDPNIRETLAEQGWKPFLRNRKG